MHDHNRMVDAIRDGPAPRDRENVGFVYVFTARGAESPSKIGKSDRHPENRVRDLERANDDQYELRYCIEIHWPLFHEYAVHALLDGHREEDLGNVGGTEWFGVHFDDAIDAIEIVIRTAAAHHRRN